jgi:hypothetical protein
LAFHAASLCFSHVVTAEPLRTLARHALSHRKVETVAFIDLAESFDIEV